jgi:SAM-dependent methyltransferase
MVRRRRIVLNFTRAAATLAVTMSDGKSIAHFQEPTRATSPSPSYGPRDEASGVLVTTPPTGSTPNGLWERQLHAWKLLGPPLRPSPEDVAAYEATVVNWSRQHGPPRGLILGATPELAWLSWPVGADVLAVDRSQAMIEHIWPGYPAPGQGGRCGDWLNLPLPNGSRDVVLGDGPFTQLDFPDGYRSVARSLRRVLSGHGVVAIRFFLKHERGESPEQVLADLWDGRIHNFHVFKWRLAMALQESVEKGVEVHAIWRYWAAAVNPDELARHLGWSAEVIATMDNYRGLAVRYTFPTRAELRQVLSHDFTEVNCQVPTYALGERCPILTLRPRAATDTERPET